MRAAVLVDQNVVVVAQDEVQPFVKTVVETGLVAQDREAAFDAPLVASATAVGAEFAELQRHREADVGRRNHHRSPVHQRAFGNLDRRLDRRREVHVVVVGQPGIVVPAAPAPHVRPHRAGEPILVAAGDLEADVERVPRHPQAAVRREDAEQPRIALEGEETLRVDDDCACCAQDAARPGRFGLESHVDLDARAFWPDRHRAAQRLEEQPTGADGQPDWRLELEHDAAQPHAIRWRFAQLEVGGDAGVRVGRRTDVGHGDARLAANHQHGCAALLARFAGHAHGRFVGIEAEALGEAVGGVLTVDQRRMIDAGDAHGAGAAEGDRAGLHVGVDVGHLPHPVELWIDFGRRAQIDAACRAGDLRRFAGHGHAARQDHCLDWLGRAAQSRVLHDEGLLGADAGEDARADHTGLSRSRCRRIEREAGAQANGQAGDLFDLRALRQRE